MNPSPSPKAASRHELNDTALGNWLLETETIPELKLPVVSTKIGYGQSNPTYFVDDAAYVVTSQSSFSPHIRLIFIQGNAIHSEEEAIRNHHLAGSAPSRSGV